MAGLLRGAGPGVLITLPESGCRIPPLGSRSRIHTAGRGRTAALAWIALADALAEYQLLAELDWKKDSDEIRSQLRGLASRPSVDPWVLVEADDMLLPAHEFLEACGRCFRDVGAALAVLDIESDCCPVVCLRAARVEELTALAARAGFTARGCGV
ncbi:hypothetical protein [Streptomyces sp. NPDC088727]|uniref:DUF6630 family protein n=1 Tax=Streptomyces sp. NPDC088727 TaxID=3365875 RepID=UPI00382CD771